MADWYYTSNGQQAGPVDLPTLRQMAESGSLSATDLVFGPGLKQWTAVGKIRNLKKTAPAGWHYVLNGQQVGPVDVQLLRKMLEGGSLSPTELVYGPGLAQWTPAGQVPDLATENTAVTSAEPAPDEQTYGVVAGSVADPASASPTMIDYRGADTGSCGLSPVAMNALRATGPWVRFMSIMIFIGAGFMAVFGVVMLFAGQMAPNARRGGNGGDFVAGIGLVYFVLAVLYAIPGVLLTRFANSISRLARTQQMRDVEQALGAQKSFWKFMGIMLIVIMCLYAIGAVALVMLKMR